MAYGKKASTFIMAYIFFAGISYTHAGFLSHTLTDTIHNQASKKIPVISQAIDVGLAIKKACN